MDNEALTAVKEGNLSKLQERLNEGIDVNTQDENGRTLLHHAASNGKHTIAKCLLQNGADVLITSEKGNTALHIAASRNSVTAVNVILENVTRDKLRKLLDAKTKVTGITALHVAAKAESSAHACSLLGYGAKFEMTNEAGEKPIDLATSESVQELFKLIYTSFEKAKEGVIELADELEKLNPQEFSAVLNCRNNEGHTIMQVIIINEHYYGIYRLSCEMLYMRVNQPINRKKEPLHDPKLKCKLGKLLTAIREYEEFWEKRKRDTKKIVEKMINRGVPTNLPELTEKAVRSCASVVQKAHETLVAYRKFEGEQRSLLGDTRMKTLEEAMEVLGFDVEGQCIVAKGEEARYYDELPATWKENADSMMRLIDSVIDGSIDYFSGYAHAVHHLDAVQEDNTEKVEQLIEQQLTNHGPDPEGRTALYHAVNNNNEKMVELLLGAHAGVNYLNALSPVYLAVKKGNCKIVDMLLTKVHHMDLPTFIDHREEDQSTALHAAAELGRLDIVKTLLRFSATYCILDKENRTPADLSTNEEVTEYFKLVEQCFIDARRSNPELVDRLAALEKNEFLSLAKTRNLKGETIADVAGSVKAKDIEHSILKMIDLTFYEVL